MKRERSAMKPDSDGRMDTKTQASDAGFVGDVERFCGGCRGTTSAVGATLLPIRCSGEQDDGENVHGARNKADRQRCRACSAAFSSAAKLMRRLNNGSASATMPRGFRG
ncbi:MAG: hypothetical protein IPM54_39810 [Polyangiaceae bacterium]|nr:hypothetical protein [Polyangiaceae bacterium]